MIALHVKKSDLDNDIESVINKILDLNTSSLIVRSSSYSEDCIMQSNAGAFLSVFDVKAERLAIIDALYKVADSMPNNNDEILIQPYLCDIMLCGVAFSVDKDNFSPYYCIECDNSGSNNSITDGSAKSKISYFAHRECDLSILDDSYLIRIIKLICELGEYYGISKEDMAHFDISDILSLYSTLYSKSPKQKLLDEIARHKEEYALTLAIKLPSLISNKSQIFAFKSEQIICL